MSDVVRLYEVDRHTALLWRPGDLVAYVVTLNAGERWNGFPADAGALLAGRVDARWTVVDLDKLSAQKRDRLMRAPIAEWRDGKVHEVSKGDSAGMTWWYSWGNTEVVEWSRSSDRRGPAKAKAGSQRSGRTCERRRRRKINLGPRDEAGLLLYHAIATMRLAREAAVAAVATLRVAEVIGSDLGEMLCEYRDTEDGPIVSPVPAAIIDRVERMAISAEEFSDEAAETGSVVLAALGESNWGLKEGCVLDRLSDGFRVVRVDQSSSGEALARMARELAEDQWSAPTGGT